MVCVAAQKITLAKLSDNHRFFRALVLFSYLSQSEPP